MKILNKIKLKNVLCGACLVAICFPFSSEAQHFGHGGGGGGGARGGGGGGVVAVARPGTQGGVIALKHGPRHAQEP